MRLLDQTRVNSNNRLREKNKRKVHKNIISTKSAKKKKKKVKKRASWTSVIQFPRAMASSKMSFLIPLFICDAFVLQ